MLSLPTDNLVESLTLFNLTIVVLASVRKDKNPVSSINPASTDTRYPNQIPTILIGQFVYNTFFHPLAGFPGPVLYGGSHLPKIRDQLRGTVHETMLALHEKYGPVVRIAPNELTYTSATAFKEIYGNTHKMPPQLSLGATDAAFFGATAFIWLADHAQHIRRRRLLAPSFADAALRVQETVVQDYAKRLVAQLRKGHVVDASAWCNYFSFDVIGDLTFNESFDCVRDAQFHPWISFIFSNLTNMMFAQIACTMLGSHVATALEKLVPRKIWAEAVAHAQATRDKVDRRLARSPPTPDVVAGVEKHLNQAGGLTAHELYADANILLMAGSETTATLLAVALYYLLRNPEKLAKVQHEVRGAFPAVVNDDDNEDRITYAILAKLPYLHCVINESLRIHPALPAGINRTVPEGGAVIDGRFVAEHTILQVPHWAAFHLPENFTDPWEFVPERWADKCPERYAGDNKEVFQPFSLGQRNCIGRSLAHMEAKILLARLLVTFDMELMPESLDWNQQKVFLLWEKRPLWIKFTEVAQNKQAKV